MSVRHPATTGIMRHFTYDHLPAPLQAVSKPVCELAFEVDLRLPDGPELAAGLRKLLEAKDCFVRAQLEGTATPVAQIDIDALRQGGE